MIPDFANTVRQDITCIQNYINSSLRDNEDSIEKKVTIAAIRIFAVVAMAFAACSIFPAFTATTGGQALSRLVYAVAIYVLSHGVFIISVNIQRGFAGEAISRLRGVACEFQDACMGKKNLAPRHHLTEGTLLRPLWNVMIDLLGIK